MSGLLGKKIGMTRIFDDSGMMIPVTVVKAGPCYVTQVKKASEKDGYDAVQLGFDEKKEKNTTRPVMGHLQKVGAPALRLLKTQLRNNQYEVKSLGVQEGLASEVPNLWIRPVYFERRKGPGTFRLFVQHRRTH